MATSPPRRRLGETVPPGSARRRMGRTFQAAPGRAASEFGCGRGRAEPPAPRIFELRQHSRGDVADMATSPPRRRLGETVPPGSARRRMGRTFQAAPGRAASEFGCGRGRAEPPAPRIFELRQHSRGDVADMATSPPRRRLGETVPPGSARRRMGRTFQAAPGRAASEFGCGRGRAEPPAPRIFELRHHSRGDVADMATSPPRRRLGETVPPGSARRRMGRTFQAAPGRAASEFGCGRGRAEPPAPRIFELRHHSRGDVADMATSPPRRRLGETVPPGSARRRMGRTFQAAPGRAASEFGCGRGRAEPPAPRIFELRQHSRGDVADMATSPPRRRLGETVPPGSVRRRMGRTFQAAPARAASEFGCGHGRAEDPTACGGGRARPRASRRCRRRTRRRSSAH